MICLPRARIANREDGKPQPSWCGLLVGLGAGAQLIYPTCESETLSKHSLSVIELALGRTAEHL